MTQEVDDWIPARSPQTDTGVDDWIPAQANQRALNDFIPHGGSFALTRGAVGSTAGLVGGTMELAPGAVGRAGAALSRWGEEQARKASEEAPILGRVGQVIPYAVPVGRGLQILSRAPSILGGLARGALSGGALGYLSPTGEEDEAKREEAKRSSALLGLGLGGVLGGGGAAVQAAIPPVRRVVSRLTGEEATRAGERMVAEIEAAGRQTATGLESEQARLQGQLATTRAGEQAATRAAERAARREAGAISGLGGVRTREEFGQYAAVPSTQSEIGAGLRAQVTRFIDSIKAQRAENANRFITEARDSAMAREMRGERFIDSTRMQGLQHHLGELLQTETDPAVARQIQTMQQALFEGTQTARPTFISAETIRRKIGDAAFGVPAEGYEAIGQNIARDIYGRLSTAMREFEPSFGKYLDDYKRLSQRLEAVSSRVGQSLVGTERNAPGFFSVAAQDIPNRVFNSPESVQALTQALGGNRQPVMAAAERYFAGQLEGKTAEQARAFLSQDRIRGVLDELGPSFRSRIQSRFLSAAETQSGRAAAGELTAQKMQTRGREIERQISALAPEVKEVREGLDAIRHAIGEKAKNEAAARFLGTLKGRVTPEAYASMEDLVNQLKAAEQSRGHARRVALSLTGGGGAAILGARRLGILGE